MNNTFMTIQSISVKKLKSHYQVFAVNAVEDSIEEFDVWGTEATEKSVKFCIDNNILESRSLQSIEILQLRLSEFNDYNHSARIAYLVINKDTKPIELDVGCPSSGYYSTEFVPDGNHRLAAAIFRKDKTIEVDYGGEVEYFNHLFIRKNKKYQEM